MKDRIAQVNSVITRTLSELICTEIVLPVGAIVTITRVSVAKDLHSGRVGIAIWPDTHSKSATAAIKKQWAHIQHLLRQKMHVRIYPQLMFYIDSTEKKAFDMEELLDSLDTRANRAE